jgi:ATP-dependent Zn protease
LTVEGWLGRLPRHANQGRYGRTRADEEVVYGDETTGAENDIRQARELARQMVGRFGMSEEIGFVAVLPQDGEASAIAALSRVSERTRQRVDEEVMRDWPGVEGAGS